MYRDWYVAYVNQMSAEDTASFLIMTEVLKSSRVEVSLQKFALEEAESHLDLNMQIYILPYLAKIAVNDKNLLKIEAQQIIYKILSDCKNSAAKSMVDNIGIPNVLCTYMKKIVNKKSGLVSLAEDDYITLTESIDSIICLSVLLNYEKSIINNMLKEESCEEFLKNALLGSFGRYPMILAQEICLLSDSELPDNFVKAGMKKVDFFYETPDTIEICLKSYFQGRTAEEIVIHTFETEPLFDRIIEHSEENSQFWLFYGLPEGERAGQYQNQLRILWENMAVYFAVETAFEECSLQAAVRLISLYWEQLVKCNDLQSLRCPWMFRINQKYIKSQSVPFLEYPRMEKQTDTLKAVASAPILSFLFSNTMEILPEFLYELVLNHVDAYSDVGITQYIKNGCFRNKGVRTSDFSEAFILLLAYAKKIMNYIGKGYLDGNAPKQIFSITKKYSKQLLNDINSKLPLQKKHLHCGPSVMICARFSYEEASAEFPEVREGNYWMEGEGNSFASEICKIALNDLWEYICTSEIYESNSQKEHFREGHITIPVDLAYEHFPQILQESKAAISDWLGDGEKAPNNTQIMLLKSYDSDEWEGCWESKEEREQGGVKKYSLVRYPIGSKSYRTMLAALAHRVYAILGKDESITGEDRDALDQWTCALLKMAEPKDFPRSLRFLSNRVLTRFISKEIIRKLNSEESQSTIKDTQDMIQILVETTADLSKYAPFYQYIVAKSLIEGEISENYPGADRALKCAWFYIMLSQEREGISKRLLLIDPYLIKEQEYSEDIRCQIIFWYIGNIGCRFNDKYSTLRMDFIRILEKFYQREGYQKEKIIIERDHIKIEKDGKYIEICNTETTDEDWYEWEPDVLQVSKMVWNESGRNQEVIVKKTKDGYVLLEKGFLELLLEYGFSACETFRVVLQDGRNKKGYLFSVGTGNNYRIQPEFIEKTSLNMLHEKIYENTNDIDGYPTGLYLDVQISVDIPGKIPLLKIVKFSKDNLEYMRLFQESDRVSIKKEDNSVQVIKGKFQIEARVNDRFELLEKEAEVREGGWNACGQRCAKVILKAVEKKELKISGSDAQRKKRIGELCTLWKVEEHDPIFLRVKLSGKNLYRLKKGKGLSGITEENIPVKIDESSLTLGTFKYNPKRKYIECLVTDTPRIDSRLGKTDGHEGLVWEIPENLNGTEGRIGFIYIDDNELKVAQEGTEKLENCWELPTIYIGMPIIYDKSAGCVAPVFYCPKDKKLSAGKYTVRYLWKMSKKNMAVEEGCFDLGTHRLKKNEIPVHLIQNFRTGIVYALERKEINEEQLQEEINESSHRVEITRYGKDLLDIHYKKIVIDEMERISELYPSQNSEQNIAKRYFEKYEAWQNDEDWIINGYLHAEGCLVENNGKQYFEIQCPVKRLPVNGSEVSETEPGKWGKTICVINQKGHLVKFSRKVFAKILLLEDGSFQANIDGAETFSWERFQKWLRKEYNNQGKYNFPLFYMDGDKDSLLFEWEIGRHFKIPRNRFKFYGRSQKMNTTDVPLFYGDSINSFEIAGNGKLAVLRAKIEDYQYSVEHRIKIDAENGILQYINVRFDKEKDTVVVEESTVSEYSLINDDRDTWSFKPLRASRLKESVSREVKQALPNGGTGCILVQLDTKKSKKKLQFKTVDLTNKKWFIMCLKGGEIRLTDKKRGNDYYVKFSPELQDHKIIGQNTKFSINVYRRSFSYNESILRVYYTKDKKAFQKQMLVKVVRDEQGNYQGNIKDTPCRPESVVRDWISRFDDQNVVIGKKAAKDFMRVEIKPGIFCEARFHPQDPKELKEGMTGRLSLREESLFVEPISYSDDSFLSEGRIVELLMLDSVFGEVKKKEHFTIAGMPQIMLGNQELSEKLKKRCPPRYGKIGQGTTLEDAGNVNFGLLKVENIDGREEGVIYKYKRKDQKRKVYYNKITFFDTNISEIINHIKRGQWHYHDRVTQVGRKYFKYGESDLPVIFDSQWFLRYGKKQKEKYVYPPHELEEFGIPEEQYGLDGRYPIAGKEKGGILVELSPGRIVMIPDSLLFVLDNDKKSGMICTKYISEGDTVKLATSAPEPGKPMHIYISGVEYGFRSIIKKKAFLPVVLDDEECTILGDGFFKIKYPSRKEKPGRKEEKQRIYILNEKNKLIPRGKRLPEPGDLVFLKINFQKELKIIGFNNFSVCMPDFAGEKKNDNACFGGLPFDNECRNRFWEIMEYRLPVVVNKITENKMEVYYPQPDSLPENNSILYCQVIGALHKTAVCFRSGAFLFCIDIKKEMHLSNEELGREIAERFKPEQGIWIYYVNGSFKIGCYKNRDKKRQIEIKETIDCVGGNGFLCEDLTSHELYWMPVDNVSRAKGISAEEVYDILFSKQRKRKQISVEMDAQGHASYLQNNILLSVPFNNLKVNDREKKIKVIVSSNVKGEERQYVCYERPQGNIYILKTELKHKLGEKLDSYCIEKGENTAVLMPYGEMRSVIHLSFQILEAVHGAYRAPAPGRQDKEIQSEILTASLKIYREKGWKAVSKLAECLKRLVNLKERYGITDSCLIECKSNIQKVLKEYISLLICKEEHNTGMNLENMLFVSGAALFSEENIWRETGEKIYSRIKKNIIYYCCEEVLLEKWFLFSEYDKYDLRSLLDTVYFGGVGLGNINGKAIDDKPTDQMNGWLTVNQEKKIVNVCETILRRNREDESEDHIKLALCLLKVSGQMEKFSQYESELQAVIKETVCYKLLGKEENIDNAVKRIFELSENNAFHYIGIQEVKDISECLAAVDVNFISTEE